MHTPNNTMKNTLVNTLQKQLPKITFREAATFYWSPGTSTIHVNNAALERPEGQWALLHEVAHALHDHRAYQTDAGLLMLEVEAWQTAQRMSQDVGVNIDDDHVQDCLNTYRDWVYARSTCPTCGLNSLQIDETTYLCLNCASRWSVSQSRFCRPYRMQDRHKKTPSEFPQTVFV